MADFYTFNDFMQRRRESFIPADQFMQSRMPFLSMDDFMAKRMGMDIQSYKNLKKYKREEDEYRGILPILEQFGRGALGEATFGISKKLIGEEAPEGMGERIARGAGQFAGFLVPYGAAAKGIGYGAKALGLTNKLIKGSKIAKELAIAGRVGRGALTLGTASAISDLPSAIEDPMSALKRGAEGAKLGAIFGAAGFINMPEHKAISWMLRQTGGRAMMAAANMYDPTTMTKENLAETVFHEAMNTFFLHHGVTPEMILTGKFKTPDQKALYEMLDADVVDYNIGLSRLKLPMTEFSKQKTEKVLIDDIRLGVDQSILPRGDIQKFKGMIKKGVASRKVIKAEWDAEEGKYKAIDRDSEFLVALQESLVEAAAEKREMDKTWRIQVVGPEAAVKTKLPRPIEMAMKFWSSKKIDSKFLVMLDTTKHWAYDFSTKVLRPVKQMTSQVGEREVLFQRSDWDKAKARWHFIPVAKGSKVPSFEWNAQKIFSRHMDDTVYRRLEGEISRMEELHPNLKSGTYLGVPQDMLTAYENARTNLYNMYKRNVILEDASSVQMLKGMESRQLKKKWASIDKIVEDAEGRLKKLYSIPNLELPDSYVHELDARLRNLKAGIDIETMRKSLDEKGALKVHQLPFIEEKILHLEKLPPEDRISYMFESIMSEYGLTHPPLTGERLRKQTAIESLERQRRKSALAQALDATKKDPRSGSVMRQLLTLPRLGMWRDRNKSFNAIQNKSGAPLFDIGEKLRYMEGDKRVELGKKTKFLNSYIDLSPEDQANVFLYYRKLYQMESVRGIQLNEKQAAYIKDINSVMKELAPLIIEERHKMWMDTVYYPEMEITGKVADPSIKAFPRQNDPDVRSFLYKGAEAWKEWKIKKNRAYYDNWVKEAIDRQIGSISEDVYLPEFVVMIDKNNLRYDYEASNIGYTGRGHFKSREVLKDKLGDVDLVNSLAEDFRDKNLNVRLHAYVNQVLNVKYIDPYLEALEKVVNVFPGAFKDAKPPGLGRKGIEAKTLSLLDYLRLYAHRIKGYPVKVGPIGEALRSLQSLFFRSLTVRPFLITRNLPQRFVTAPHKANVLDPKYLLRTQYKFDALPESAKNLFHSAVSQWNAFKQDYLQLMQTEKMKDWPVIGPFLSFAERVGSLYSLSDEYNRRYVFSKVYFRARDTLNDYFAGKTTQDVMDRKLGVGKMESNNQRVWRQYLEAKDVDGAAGHLAQWSDINTNWFYKRTEKSLPEMTGEGESFTNLLTWSKSVVQWSVDGILGAKDGLEMVLKNKNARNSPEWKAGWQKMADGSGKLIGLALCGGIANALLNTISIQKASRFKSYGSDMFMWELGGVTLDIVKQFSGTASDLITSVDGTPQERKTAIDNAMKMLDNTVIRQLLPFSKTALSVIESFTGRSHIAPVYEKWT